MSDAQGHGGTGAQLALTVEAALAAAVALAIAAGPAGAQRLPERFGLPAEEHVTATRGAASLRPNGMGAPRLPVATQAAARGVTAGSADARSSTGRSRGFLSQVVIGSVGSVAGMFGGIYLGRGVCEVTSPCGGEDPGIEHAFLGVIAGSVVGTAAGTALGASLAGVAPGSFGRRLLGATLGLLAGGAAFQLVGGDVDYVLPLATFSVTQALVTTLLAHRPPHGRPR